MARKNLIGVSDVGGTETVAPSAPSARPIAGLTPPAGNHAPVGGITRTLGSITQKMERAQELERQLTEGQTIIEVDPDLVDASFVRDRLSIDAEEIAELVAQIRDHGQQVPVLLRPHPVTHGRFQVAYGHRRLAAIRQLGVKLRAVVRDLTDEKLVVSQGQENNARKNLSYIERALFAARLEDRSFSREVIMSALAVDKAAVSKMMSVVRALPFELIEAIGAAPETGRRRWMELAEPAGAADMAAQRRRPPHPQRPAFPGRARRRQRRAGTRRQGKGDRRRPARPLLRNHPPRLLDLRPQSRPRLRCLRARTAGSAVCGIPIVARRVMRAVCP